MSIRALRFLSIEEFYFFELLASNTHNSDLSVCWNEGGNTFDVYSHILFAATMTYVNGELEHCETIFY